LLTYANTVHVVVVVGKSAILGFLKFYYLLQYGNIVTGGIDVSPVRCYLYKQYIKNNASSLFNSTSYQTATNPKLPPIAKTTNADGRSNNGGSNYRVQYSFSQKHSMVEEYNQWKYSKNDNHLPSTVSLFCEERYGENNGKKFEINIGRWRSKKEWPKIVKMTKEQDYKNFCKMPQHGKGNKFPKIEVVVYKLLRDRRKKKRKASRKWIQITALKEFKQQYKDVDNAPSFKVRISLTVSITKKHRYILQ
jgi:hypothetical protein